MTDLRLVYGAQIKEMLAAAQANVEEATANLAAKNNALDDCNKQYADLQAKTDEAQRKLNGAGSSLKRVARDRDQKTGTAIQVRAQIDQYTAYADQLPTARANMTNANADVTAAETDLERTKKELEVISYFA